MDAAVVPADDFTLERRRLAGQEAPEELGRKQRPKVGADQNRFVAVKQAVGSGFGNVVDIDASGAEMKWEQQLSDKFRIQANLSYNDTWDGRSTLGGHESPGIADRLGNLALFLQPAAKLMLSGRQDISRAADGGCGYRPQNRRRR